MDRAGFQCGGQGSSPGVRASVVVLRGRLVLSGTTAVSASGCMTRSEACLHASYILQYIVLC